MTGRRADAALALAVCGVLGTVAGTAWALTAGSTEPEQAPPGDRVRAALADFERGDHLHVAPDARARLSAADEERLERTVAAVDPPLYVALWDGDAEAGYYLEGDAVDQLAARGPSDGVYVVWSAPGEASTSARGGRAPYVDRELLLGEARLRLPEVAAAVAEEGLQEPGDGYWGGRSGAVAAGVLVGGLAAPATALLLVVGAWLARRRLPGRWT